MNNEPVAWMGIRRHGETRISVEKLDENDIPLYTHPENTCKHGVDDGACKECYQEATHPANLTDEEILDICITDGIYDCINDPYIQKDGKYSLDIDLIRFARVILRKAQEK